MISVVTVSMASRTERVFSTCAGKEADLDDVGCAGNEILPSAHQRHGAAADEIYCPKSSVYRFERMGA